MPWFNKLQHFFKAQTNTQHLCKYFPGLWRSIPLALTLMHVWMDKSMLANTNYHHHKSSKCQSLWLSYHCCLYTTTQHDFECMNKMMNKYFFRNMLKKLKEPCHNQRYSLVSSITNFGNIFVYFHNVFVISSSKLNRQNAKNLTIMSTNDLPCQWRIILFPFALICITHRAITPFNMDDINWTTTSRQTFVCICLHNPFQLWCCRGQQIYSSLIEYIFSTNLWKNLWCLELEMFVLWFIVQNGIANPKMWSHDMMRSSALIFKMALSLQCFVNLIHPLERNNSTNSSILVSSIWNKHLNELDLPSDSL